MHSPPDQNIDEMNINIIYIAMIYKPQWPQYNLELIICLSYSQFQLIKFAMNPIPNWYFCIKTLRNGEMHKSVRYFVYERTAIEYYRK